MLLSQTVERYPSFTTSVTDHPEKDFILYPNPFHDHLTVEVPHLEAKSGELLILDLSGKVEFREKIDAPGKWDIDLSGLTPGTYIIEIGTGDKKFAGKIVKN